MNIVLSSWAVGRSDCPLSRELRVDVDREMAGAIPDVLSGVAHPTV